MSVEVYKPIPLPDYKDRYLVSNMGNVKSLRSESVFKTLSKRGYYVVDLFSKGRRKHFYVARLVALAFIPNPENKPTVNHINEIKTDNRVENLEWATFKEQNVHGTRLQRAISKLISNGRRILQMDMNDNVVACFDSLSTAAKVTGVAKPHICKCANGKEKTAAGFKWRYIS